MTHTDAALALRPDRLPGVSARPALDAAADLGGGIDPGHVQLLAELEHMSRLGQHQRCTRQSRLNPVRPMHYERNQ